MRVRHVAAGLSLVVSTGLLAAIPSVSASAADPATVRTVSVADVRVFESDGAVSVPVTLTTPSDTPISVEYRTRGRRARAGLDYEPTQGQMLFAPGETQSQIEVPIVDDRVSEPTENFIVVLGGHGAVAVTDARAIVTVLDDDWTGTPVLAPAANLIDQQPVRITARGLPPAVTLRAYECEGLVSTSHLYPGPCDAVIGSVITDSRGRIDATLEVQRFVRFYDDLLYDCAFEGCSLWLREASSEGIAFGRPVGLGFRLPNPVPKLSMQSITVAEGSGPGTIAYVPVHLDRPADGPVLIFPTSVALSATAADFSVETRPVSIPAGSTDALLPVYIVNDGLREADEVFAVIVRYVSGAELSTINGAAFVTIAGE